MSWLVHWLEQRRPVAELRPSAAPGGLIMGAIIGFVILSAVLGILYLMGAAKFALPMPILFPSLATGVAVISGVAEECIFRGAVFRNLEDGFGSLVALIFSGALFGGLHIFNPNATLFSSIAIAVEAGLLLGAAFMATRTLWLPIGLHFGWNFTEGGFYSTAVSGGTLPGIVKTTLTGPNVLTGGAFGPEASWVTMCVCSVLTVIFLIIAARRGQWRPLQFPRPRTVSIGEPNVRYRSERNNRHHTAEAQLEKQSHRARTDHAIREPAADLHRRNARDTDRHEKDAGRCDGDQCHRHRAYDHRDRLQAYAALVHWLEKRRPIQEMRLRDAPGGLIVGFLIGVGLLSAAIGTIMLMHDASIVLDAPPVLPLGIITMAAISGVCEELIFRGALFRITEEMFGTLIALLVSGAFFGGAHIVNANATPLSSAAIAIEALVLCFAYTATRSLWLPIGLHAGWNLTEGGIYSTSVSGGPIIKGVFLTTFKGPDIITGGAFGPETSVVTLGVSLVLTIIFAVITFRRGEWKSLGLRIRATPPT